MPQRGGRVENRFEQGGGVHYVPHSVPDVDHTRARFVVGIEPGDRGAQFVSRRIDEHGERFELPLEIRSGAQGRNRRSPLGGNGFDPNEDIAPRKRNSKPSDGGSSNPPARCSPTRWL